MNTFEDKLLGELKQVVTQRAAEPAAPRRRGWRPRLVLAGMTTAAVAAGLIIGVPIVTGEDGPPAYAVEKNPDGTITVTMEEVFDQPEQLEADLRAAGVQAEARVLPPNKECAGQDSNGWYLIDGKADPGLVKFPLEDWDIDAVAPTKDADGLRFIIDPDRLAPDTTLVITHMTITPRTNRGDGSGQRYVVDLDLVKGTVPSCELVDSTMPRDIQIPLQKDR